MLVLPRSGFRYASFAGPIPGGLTAGTLLLVIVTASGTALAAGSALEGVIQEQRPDALILLTLLAGLIMVGAGVRPRWSVFPVRLALASDTISFGGSHGSRQIVVRTRDACERQQTCSDSEGVAP